MINLQDISEEAVICIVVDEIGRIKLFFFSVFPLVLPDQFESLEETSKPN